MKTEFEENKNQQGRLSPVSISYDWLKIQTHAWVQGISMFPVRVKIVFADFKNRTAKITTGYQSGTIEFDRLFQSESECPCR